MLIAECSTNNNQENEQHNDQSEARILWAARITQLYTPPYLDKLLYVHINKFGRANNGGIVFLKTNIYKNKSRSTGPAISYLFGI